MKANRNRWTESRVLAEARKQTAHLNVDNPVKLLAMLGTLLRDAGWTEEEFIDALCQDIIARGQRRRAS